MTKEKAVTRQISFDEIDLPPTVYKYRVWKNLRHQTILTDRQVWFAQPSSFDDPLDCKIPIRYDLLTEQQIYDKYYYESRQMPEHQGWTRQQHRQFARNWTKKSPIKNKETLKQYKQESFNEFDIRFGVLSLTANPTSIAMWKAYSADHTGFCIGYDPKNTFKFFGGGGEVNYVDELPIIMPTPIHDYETQHFLQVFSKLKKWTYEEEYRVHKFYPEPATKEQRTITLPVEAHTEIIFGANVDEQDKKEITDIAKTTLPNVALRQARLTDSDEIKIENE